MTAEAKAEKLSLGSALPSVFCVSHVPFTLLLPHPSDYGSDRTEWVKSRVLSVSCLHALPFYSLFFHVKGCLP